MSESEESENKRGPMAEAVAGAGASAGAEAQAPKKEDDVVDDEELDALMNSAFADMNNPQSRKRGNSIGGSSLKPGSDGVDWNPSENIWSEEFLQNAAETFQNNMATLLGSLKGTNENINKDQVLDTFKMMAEAASQVMIPLEEPQSSDKGKIKSSNDVSAAIAKTLDGLNSNVDDLEKSDEELTKIFSGLGIHNQDGTPNLFVPFMQNMMQSLLSKEVLYPSLKAMIDKYPEWLINNKHKLEKKEFERFTKQNHLMVRVCEELEKEKETDSEEIKKKRFDVLLELMQKMQDLGQPPADLAEETNFGEHSMEGLTLPSDPNQCRPM